MDTTHSFEVDVRALFNSHFAFHETFEPVIPGHTSLAFTDVLSIDTDVWGVAAGMKAVRADCSRTRKYESGVLETCTIACDGVGTLLTSAKSDRVIDTFFGVTLQQRFDVTSLKCFVHFVGLTASGSVRCVWVPVGVTLGDGSWANGVSLTQGPTIAVGRLLVTTTKAGEIRVEDNGSSASFAGRFGIARASFPTPSRVGSLFLAVPDSTELSICSSVVRSV